jgi:hypothetical protein
MKKGGGGMRKTWYTGYTSSNRSPSTVAKEKNQQTNSTTNNQPMVIPAYQWWDKVSPIKTVKKKWRERCDTAKTVGQTMAMGIDSRGFVDLR